MPRLLFKSSVVTGTIQRELLMDSCSCVLEKMELKKLIQEDLLKLSDLRNIKTTEIFISSDGKGRVLTE